MLKNDGSYEGDIQQRCAKADSAFNSLTTVACDRPPSPTKSSCESTSPRFPYQYIRIEDSTIARLLLPAGVHKEELYDPRWKSLPDPKRKFWTDVVKEDLRTLGSSFETPNICEHFVFKFVLSCTTSNNDGCFLNQSVDVTCVGRVTSHRYNESESGSRYQ
ncbi:hypothetical protein RB195_024374 [Necator americanus]|uniref:Uncharacterized protein n=1 Tax=Necator americanus TaxID=51031 RepID=A0ABR1EMX2_NECAM